MPTTRNNLYGGLESIENILRQPSITLGYATVSNHLPTRIRDSKTLCISCQKPLQEKEGEYLSQPHIATYWRIIDAIKTVDGNIHKGCLSKEKYNLCDRCGLGLLKTGTDREKIGRKFGEKLYCCECYQNNIYTCCDCEGQYDTNISEFYSYDDNQLCAGCYENDYFSCSDCDGVYHNNDAIRCENCDDNYCDNCLSENHNHDEDEEINPPRWEREIQHPQFLKGKEEECTTITVDRFVGCEIEAENGDRAMLKKLDKTIAISGDGSLSSTGIEIQTPPASLSELERIITHACQHLKSIGYKGTKSCGVHVHVDARDFKDDPVKIVKLIKTFYACEDILFSMLPPSRWTNHYCQRLSKNYLFKVFSDETKIDESWYKTNAKNILRDKKARKFDDSRYYGINIHSIYFRGTVEFRYHSGTVEETKILKWIEILLKMVDYALNHYDEKKITQMYDQQTNDMKFRWFCELFGIPRSLEIYMRKRMGKFNRNWMIQFNKGKKEREKDEKNWKEKMVQLEALKKKLRPQSKKEVIRNCRIGNYTLSFRVKDTMTDEELLKFAEVKAYLKSYISNMARSELNIPYNYEEQEGGFLQDSDLTPIVSYITQGMEMARESDPEGNDL